jgi:serine/threonine-protein kinase
MPLSVGDCLGPYEIRAGIGAGGMGEVYRASDPRLHRDVAIKIATAQFSDRSAREARLVAALNHPNICHVYDVGPNYLVMELIEGPTLAERLRQGPVPLEEALVIAGQIGEALEAAHEKGIVHRDLKPGNIKVKHNGTVKVLDFGLAKGSEDPAVAGAPENSPTMTLEQATRIGTVVGTAGYMAPEQARGKPVDKRADIWAFGVVLYEMVTGQRLFQGETVSDTLAAVLTREPDWTRVPPKVERLLRRCLEKDPKRRLRDIGDARLLLEEAPARESAPPKRNWPWRIATAALAIGLAVVLGLLWRSTSHPHAPVLRLSVDFGEDAALSPLRGSSLAISPDGSRVAFLTGQPPIKSRLAVRRLDQAKPMPVAGTDGAEAPFFSPDGKSIGFFAGGKLKKIDAAGGTPVTLCDAPSQREGSWADDDNIVFAATNAGGLSRVPSRGGTPQVVTQLEAPGGEETHRYPQVLPGSHAVLYMNKIDNSGEGGIVAHSFQTGKSQPVVKAGAYGRYLPSGHLVYIHGGTLFAAPMDPDRLQLTGPSVPVLEDVNFNIGTGAAGFTFSQSGTFVYVVSSPEDHLRPIVLMDEKGKSELLPVPKAKYGRPRVSPDGTRLAVAIEEGPGTHIWIYEWASQRFSRLPFSNGNSKYPVWTHDGKYLAFFSDAQAPGPGVYWMRADGAGAPKRLIEGANLVPSSISSAPARLVYAVTRGPQAGLWNAPLDWSDGTRPKLGVPERFPDASMDTPASFSPDGRFIAYLTGQSGMPEIFVRPYPAPGGPWQVSSGGASAVWSRGGHELFYQGKSEARVMVAPYSIAGDSFSPGRPRPWSEARVDSFDVMPDGKHVVLIPPVEQKEATHATFLLNFMDDLRRRVPAGK